MPFVHKHSYSSNWPSPVGGDFSTPQHVVVPCVGASVLQFQLCDFHRTISLVFSSGMYRRINICPNVHPLTVVMLRVLLCVKQTAKTFVVSILKRRRRDNKLNTHKNFPRALRSKLNKTQSILSEFQIIYLKVFKGLIHLL